MSYTPTQQDYASLGYYVAALMGANEEWDSPADYLEMIAEKAQALGANISDQDAGSLAFWRKIADDLGIEHDGEEPEPEAPTERTPEQVAADLIDSEPIETEGESA